jgi:hypothetical protein
LDREAFRKLLVIAAINSVDHAAVLP